MSVAMGTPAAIGQPLNSAFLITIKDLVTRFKGDAKLPAKFRHAFASQPPSHKLQSLIHHRTLLPRHSLPPQSVTYVSGTICYLCVGSLNTKGSKSCMDPHDRGMPHPFVLRMGKWLFL